MLNPLVREAFASVLMFASSPAESPTVVVDHDNVTVTASCVLSFAKPVKDEDGNGVVHIVGEGITVDFGGQTLDAGTDRSRPHESAGVGVTVEAKGVTLTNGGVRGFKVGIRAQHCDGATFSKLDVSDNYAARLKSTNAAEESSDWLYPHDNDEGEQLALHGAGLSVCDAKNVVIREVRARRTQNGIMLRRVEHSKIYDNDCSFLSGWGLAMWRSSHNIISRNSFDFCIRGYSHGVYNRGQDSAGILLFEQCCANTIALNSCTHGGDGIFAFAGREALGEKARQSSASDGTDPSLWYRTRGCNDNLIALNDLSYAAAHGLEMTFSFGNRFLANRIVENGIHGIWAGYSRDSIVAENTFAGNVAGAFAGEHTQRSLIARNHFTGTQVGVLLWDDVDASLATLPWTTANSSACLDNMVVGNTFTNASVAIGLREAVGTVLCNNTFTECAKSVDEEKCVDTATEKELSADIAARLTRVLGELPGLMDTLPGTRTACGARARLQGRASIIMGEFGPQEPALDPPSTPTPEKHP